MDFAAVGIIFSLVMGVSLYLNWQGRYISQPLLFSGYFFLASVLIVFLFPTVLGLLQPYVTVILILCAAYILAVLGYGIRRHSLRAPTEFIARHGIKNAFIRLEYPFLFTKGFEIAFQQLCFAVFVLLVSMQGVGLLQLSLLSAAVLFILHIPLWFTHGAQWGSFYISSSIILGFVFPYLVLFVPGGLSFTFALHLLAYVVAGVVVWGFPKETNR